MKRKRVFLKNGDFIDVRPLMYYEQIACFLEICKLARVNGSCDIADLTYKDLADLTLEIIKLTNQQNAEALEILKGE